MPNTAQTVAPVDEADTLVGEIKDMISAVKGNEPNDTESKSVKLPAERINPRPDFPVQIRVVEGTSIDKKTGKTRTYRSIVIETPTGNISGLYENVLHVMHSLMVHEKRDQIATLFGQALVELALAKGRTKVQKTLASHSI